MNTESVHLHIKSTHLTHHPVQIELFLKPPLNLLASDSPPHCCKFRKHTSAGMETCCEYSLTDSLTGWCHRLMRKKKKKKKEKNATHPDMFVKCASESRK